MSNVILKYYPIYIETFSSNVKSSNEIFPPISNFVTYSKQRTESIDPGHNGIDFLAFRKNKNEIGKTYYRNGILDSNSLNSYIHNRRLYVEPGEYVINGETVTLLSTTTREQATQTDTENLIENFFADNISINPNYGTISSYVYKSTFNKDLLFVSPKDNANTDETYINPTTYIAYDISADLNDLVVNNYLSLGENSVQRILPGGSNLLISDAEENPNLLMENLGTADGSYNLVFQTKYYPTSIPTPSNENTIEFFGNQKTHIRVKDSEGYWTAYQAYDSYILAESSGNPNSCYLDRFNGRIYFARETFKSDTPIAIPGPNISPGAFSRMTVPYAVGELLDDNGFLLLSGTGVFDGEEEEVRFDKINNTTLEIKNYEGNYVGANTVYIAPANKLTPPNGEVYIKYSAVIGFQKEINNTVKENLSKEIEPWTWSNQRTIAVISKSEAYPYYINLKCVDTPFLRFSDGTSIYGPLYSGSEIVLLEGEVLSYDGEPIASQEVEIFLVSGSGLINLETTATVVTDDLGKFYASYNPRVSRLNWIVFKDSDVVRTLYPSYTTKLKVNAEYNDLSGTTLPPTGIAESIVYAIRNDDGAVGSVGTVYPVPSPEDFDEDIANYPPYQNNKLGEIFEYDANNKAVLIYDGIRDEDIVLYNGSTMTLCFITDGEIVQRRVNIKNIVKYPEAWYDNDLGEFRFMHERQRISTYALLLDNEQESLWNTVTSIFQINLHTKEEVQYDPDALNGKKVVLIENKPEGWGHPSTDNLYPVYGPVMTTSFNKENMEYTINKVVPLSSTEGSSYSAGIVGYAISPDNFAIVQAKTLSKNDKYIYSNKVGFEIKLANRDIGVVTALLSGLKIPYGFRLWDNQSEDSSAIGTSTFLTVNSLAGTQTRDPQFPLVSYVDANGIIYLGNRNVKTPFDGGSSSVDIKIEVSQS